MTADPRWRVTAFTPEGWRLIASGRSRLRGILILLICTSARPDVPHNLRWKKLP